VTFRFKGHYAGDPQKYMPAEELAAAEAADPIPRYREKLVKSGLCSEEELATIDRQSTERVEAALEEVLAAPPPDVDEIEKDFYVEMKGVPA
jgi:pyruvate dehydrogenase E1 component alpha subunit